MIKLEFDNDKPPKKIWIRWIDSMSYSAKWYFHTDVAELLQKADLICESVGYFLYEDDEKLAYCDSISHGDEKKISGMHGLHFIPLVAIEDWRYL